MPDVSLHPFAREAIKYGALWVDGGPLDGFIAWKSQWMPVAIEDRALPRNAEYRLREAFKDECRGKAAPFLTWCTKADVISSLGSRRPG